MTQTYNYNSPSPIKKKSILNDRNIYTQTMIWIGVAFASALAGLALLGPLIPPAYVGMLSLVIVVGLLATAFIRRRSSKVDRALAIIVPFLLGSILYSSLKYYVSIGAANIIVLAAIGTIVAFGTAAVLGWNSKKSINSWAKPMFGILIGIIVLSVLNMLIFHLTILSLLISIGALILFTIYSYIDIQIIRDARDGDRPESMALNIFLDIFNIFTSLLNILGILRT